jgi:ubiquitin conjugation factor E4 B
MERALIKTPSEIEQFRSLAEKANEIAIQNIKREVDYSDAPDEFRGKCIIVTWDLHESVT